MSGSDSSPRTIENSDESLLRRRRVFLQVKQEERNASAIEKATRLECLVRIRHTKNLVQVDRLESNCNRVQRPPLRLPALTCDRHTIPYKSRLACQAVFVEVRHEKMCGYAVE